MFDNHENRNSEPIANSSSRWKEFGLILLASIFAAGTAFKALLSGVQPAGQIGPKEALLIVACSLGFAFGAASLIRLHRWLAGRFSESVAAVLSVVILFFSLLGLILLYILLSL